MLTCNPPLFGLSESCIECNVTMPMHSQSMGLMRAVGNGGVCPTLEAAIGHNRWQAVSHLPRGCCKFLQNTEESNNHVLRHEAVGDALGRPRAALARQAAAAALSARG